MYGGAVDGNQLPLQLHARTVGEAALRHAHDNLHSTSEPRDTVWKEGSDNTRMWMGALGSAKSSAARTAGVTARHGKGNGNIVDTNILHALHQVK